MFRAFSLLEAASAFCGGEVVSLNRNIIEESFGDDISFFITKCVVRGSLS